MSRTNIIPYGRQFINQDDINAVVDVLQSDFLTQGPTIKQFEEDFAEYVGAKFAVAVANGTAALHLANLAIGTMLGDKVITTPITFAASANAVLYCGGEIEFVDIDPKTYLIDLDLLEKKLRSAPKGTYSGVVPVDFAGLPVNSEKLRRLADEFDLWIIEDACHAPGGYFIDSKEDTQKCGNGNYADLAIFSFHPVKHIACGEGGMITTNDRLLYERLLKLRTHGITRNSEEFQNEIDIAINPTANLNPQTANYPGWYMEMHELGYNYRLTDFQAALGISQLGRADEGLKRRKKIAKSYYDAFKNSSKIISQSGVVDGHAYHLYIIETEDRLGLYEYLRANNIYAQIHYIPVHLMPYYRKLGWGPGDMPNAEAYYSRCISLPIYPSLTDEEQEYVIGKIKYFFTNG